MVEATVWSPKELRGSSLGRAAAFSALPLPSGSLRAWTPADDPRGCSDYGLPANRRVAVVAVVRQGGCSFVSKARAAQRAGAAGLVVVSEGGALRMTAGNETAGAGGLEIFAVSVGSAFGERLLRQLGAGEGQEAVDMSFEVYKPHTRGISLAVLIGGATVLVVLGAYFSLADLRRKVVVRVSSPGPGAAPQLPDMPFVAPQRPGQADSGALRGIDGLIFCAVGSCLLVAMYFFMQYMIYAIIFIFCIVGFGSLTFIGSWLLQGALPPLGRPASAALPIVFVADLFAASAAALVVLSWLRLQGTEWGWALQDVMGVGFLMIAQQALQLPNLKVASVVLSALFCFDVFWVLLSPLLFHQSVMVKVATSPVHGLEVPMLLRVPSFSDPFGRDRMIGFGDIALPGLLVSYLLRWDLWNKRGLDDGYFLPSVVGYCLGLCTTVAAVLTFHHGQPALLYLVPGTLGLSLLLGACRGDLASLWRGLPQDYGPCCQDDGGAPFAGPPLQVLQGPPRSPRPFEVQKTFRP